MNYNFWRGDKIRLRAIEQKDFEAVLTSTEELDTELDRFEDFIKFPVSKEHNRENLEALAKKERADDTFFWMIEDLQGNHVGYINTFDCERRTGTFKYAIIIKRPYWGHGYAREAITIVLRYYFRELRYQKVTVLVYAFNERSMRLHEKLGFQLEGRLRRMAYTNGDYYDELYYGMTIEEFDQFDRKPNLKDFAEHQS
ncbi:MAG TPA: GNAT family N-acetyltransferase [Anaerolineales bacterium]|nr:GNAT family N-acetyltransferase [Anaerolineales bacterium]HLO28483.1 GNAT family N-acetyltransferase [Anaerolineales bacterium]